MHEGFVNYNAGTLGASMVEGRISAGVVVGDGSDVGGGASIMGTLSGGGREQITVGKRCLIGANAGIGISLGDDCVVEAGCYVTAGTKVTRPDGTTVMHEGFVNYNAGTLGHSMVEGRISAGVVVGDGSDVGGGSSIMGTLSGGGSEVISIGERCLLGANAGIGISLGDDCVVEAGCYVTAGTKLRLLPEDRFVKAAELSGASGLLFWRNSATGVVEARPRGDRQVELNEALHANA